MIPICHEKDGSTIFKSIIVENDEHQIVFFDPLNRPADAIKPKHCIEVQAVCEFVRKDFKLRSGLNVSAKDYLVIEAPSPKLKSYEESGVWTLYFINQKMSDDQEPLLTESNLAKFITFLLTLK